MYSIIGMYVKLLLNLCNSERFFLKKLVFIDFLGVGKYRDAVKNRNVVKYMREVR